MHSRDFLTNKIPHLYLDMDGVQADFFTAWARLHGHDRYKEIGDKEAREASIDELSARGPLFVRDFFAGLDMLPNFPILLKWLHSHRIPYTILSAPLRGNHQASEEGKRAWLDLHHPGSSATAIFTGRKERYATKGGQANVLVDDHKKWIERWEASGGIGVLHRDAAPELTLKRLEEIYEPYLTRSEL